MFFNIIYSLVVSVIIIFVIHNIFDYFKSTLTTPKIKDLINKPKSEYERINRVINSDIPSNNQPNKLVHDTNTNNTDNNNTNNNNTNNNTNDSSDIINSELDPNFDPNNIKSELKDFFKQLNSDKSDTIDMFSITGGLQPGLGIERNEFAPPEASQSFSSF